MRRAIAVGFIALFAGAASAESQFGVEVYPGAKHGFAVTGHLAYDQESSERHWQRLTELLATHL